MPTFESWATTVSDVIEEKLGFKNVSSEVFEDHAIWTSAGAEVTGRLLGMTSS